MNIDQEPKRKPEQDDPNVCCGEFRDTRYCPDCGRQIVKHDLGTLLRHVEAQLAAVKRELADTSSDRPARIRQAALDKWEAWQGELSNVLSPEATAPSTPPRAWELELGVKARKLLSQLNITGKNELVEYTTRDIINRKYGGYTTIAEIREWLARDGLHLKGDAQ